MKSRIAANNALWAELEAQGYRCGGYDFAEKAASVVRGPVMFSKLVGWVRPAEDRPGYVVEWI